MGGLPKVKLSDRTVILDPLNMNPVLKRMRFWRPKLVDFSERGCEVLPRDIDFLRDGRKFFLCHPLAGFTGYL